MSRRRIETWLALFVGAIGLGLLAIAGLWVYVSATATPLHPVAAGRAIRDAFGAITQVGRRRRAGAADRPRNSRRAELAGPLGGGRCRRRDCLGRRFWLGESSRNSAKVAPDTQFRIGTASTALTSAAAGLLLEKGRLSLDEPIQKHVPEFPEKQWPVTLRQVMGHVAGLPNDGGDESELFAQHCDRPVDALQHFAGRSLRFEPGTQYRYSNYGWILVSAAIEAAADEPFLTFMRKQIFEPLGMDATEPDLATEAGPDRATSYFPRFAADPRYGPDLMRELDLSCYSGSSIFLSTPSDLVRFAMAINGGKLLQPATVQLLQASQRLTSGRRRATALAGISRPSTRRPAGARDWSRRRRAGRDGVVVDDVPRSRDRRVGRLEHLVCRHGHARVKIAQAFAKTKS